MRAQLTQSPRRSTAISSKPDELPSTDRRKASRIAISLRSDTSADSRYQILWTVTGGAGAKNTIFQQTGNYCHETYTPKGRALMHVVSRYRRNLIAAGALLPMLALAACGSSASSSSAGPAATGSGPASSASTGGSYKVVLLSDLTTFYDPPVDAELAGPEPV